MSRTEHPDWALPCLRAFVVTEGVSMFDMAHHREIYPVRGGAGWGLVGGLGGSWWEVWVLWVGGRGGGDRIEPRERLGGGLV